MDALLMCGGRGTRLDADVEKPLFEVGGRPMVDYVRDALAASSVETTYAVVSPQAPETRAHLENDLDIVETPGEGYVPDLLSALSTVETPVLTVAADLPLLQAPLVDRIVADSAGSTSVRVPLALKRELGASVDEDQVDSRDGTENTRWVPTGVNVVGDDEDAVLRSYDARLAVNVNRRSDGQLAERLLDARREAGHRETQTGVDDGP